MMVQNYIKELSCARNSRLLIFKWKNIENIA